MQCLSLYLPPRPQQLFFVVMNQDVLKAVVAMKVVTSVFLVKVDVHLAFERGCQIFG